MIFKAQKLLQKKSQLNNMEEFTKKIITLLIMVLLFSSSLTSIFKYDGTTSICTSSIVNASSLNTNWKIHSKSATKSNATASATCTAKQYTLGICVKTITRNLSLTCSPNGTLS